MARRKSDDKRQRILQAAVKIFARKGYHGARVSEIARRADVADGTIYLYFRNKEDILVSLFDEVMSEHLEKGRKELATLEGAAAKLLSVAECHLRLLGSNRDLAIVFQVELRQSIKFLERFTATWLHEYFSLVADVMEEGQEEGTLRPDLNRKLATKLFYGALDEMVMSWIIGGKDYDLTRLARPTVELFLNGARDPARSGSARAALAGALAGEK